MENHIQIARISISAGESTVKITNALFAQAKERLVDDRYYHTFMTCAKNV